MDKATPDNVEWWREMLEERALADEAVERFANDEAVERANKAMGSIIDAKRERGEAVDLGEVATEAVWTLDPDDIRARLIVASSLRPSSGFSGEAVRARAGRYRHESSTWAMNAARLRGPRLRGTSRESIVSYAGSSDGGAPMDDVVLKSSGRDCA
jgi:hypothetical protein